MIIATDLEPLSGSFYVRYYPALQQSFGSKQVPLIIDRLEYWFHNKKFKSGFFKFLEPCSHYLYRLGDSWKEEIGICRQTFNAAFNIIGISYESKTAYLAEEDPFKGKLYARYYDRKANQMFFVRNHEVATNFFKSLFKRKTSQNIHLQPSKTNTEINQKGRGTTSKKCRSWNAKTYRSCEGAYIDKQITTNNSSLKSVSQSVSVEVIKDEKPEEEMKKIWVEEIGTSNNTPISGTFASQMRESLTTHFDNSLEKWREYCAKIASSKFLMGEMPNTKFKAWMNWAVKPEVIERIQSQEFTLGDRKKPLVQVDRTDECQQNALNQPDEKNRFFHQFALEKLGSTAYYNWFRFIKLEKPDEDQIKILVPSTFYQQEIQKRYYDLLKEAIYLAFKRRCSYQIVVSQGVGGGAS